MVATPWSTRPVSARRPSVAGDQGPPVPPGPRVQAGRVSSHGVGLPEVQAVLQRVREVPLLVSRRIPTSPDLRWLRDRGGVDDWPLANVLSPAPSSAT